MTPQVNKDHYEFSQYMDKKRWCSVWHQIDEVISLSPSNVLEIGPGPGLFRVIVTQLGVKCETLDVAEDLKPNYIASATEMPFINNAFDVVCAFQMLEHLPFKLSLQAMKEMARVAKMGVVISLPDADRVWPYSIHIPKYGNKKFLINRPFYKKQDHLFDGEHYWELNKKGYEVDAFVGVLKEVFSEFVLVKNYRVSENPYHRFFVLKKLISVG